VITSKGYIGEFRANWSILLATAIGLSGGTAIYSYTASLFAPAFIDEFNWSKAQYSLIGMTPMLSLLGIPLAGRLADVVGVSRTALIGVIGLPLCFLALSFATGDIYLFFAMVSAKVLLGATTTIAVYSRLVAERFDKARGLALALSICGPAVVAALLSPALSEIIDTQGWRTGYQALAGFSAAAGAITLLMIWGHEPTQAKVPAPESVSKPPDYGVLLRSRVLWLIIIAMTLCNLPQTLTYLHMSLLMLAKGADPATAAYMVSLYATGIIIGRFASGIALDRWPTHIVSAFVMGAPALGLFTFASDITTYYALAAAVLVMGMSQGAEGDLAAYLVAKYFRIEVFGSALGLIVAAISVAVALGAGILSFTLSMTDGYFLFLLLTGFTVLIGAGLFLLLGTPEDQSSTRSTVSAPVPQGAQQPQL
jgi:MFS family permease